MDFFYALYIAICGTSLILSLLLVTIHLNAKEYKNISFKLILHLLLSYYIISYNRCILVSVGGLLSLLKYMNEKVICEISNGLIVVFLTSAITWMAFINFILATNKRIKLKTAIIVNFILFSNQKLVYDVFLIFITNRNLFCRGTII
jgi:hypothetical protein